MKMKRLLAIILIFVLSFSLAITAQAKTDNNSTNYNDNLVDVDIYAIDDEEQEILDMCVVNGLTRNQIVMLRREGYSDEYILTLDGDEADAILTKNMDDEEKSFYYAHISQRTFSEYKDFFPDGHFDVEKILMSRVGTHCAKCGYTLPSGVSWTHATGSGGFSADGCFHEDSGITNDNINTMCYYAKLLAMSAYGVKSSSELSYDYYMFGENFGASDPNSVHEGNDMQYYHGANVYSPISGIVSYSSKAKGRVNIYNSDLGITMNFQHMSGVDGTTTLAEGQSVTKGQLLGQQSNNQTQSSHLHIQVCNHKNCTQVHTGGDLTLECISPYREY